MTPDLTPHTSEYTIDPFPFDTANGRHWRVSIRRRKSGWVVCTLFDYVQADGDWYPNAASAQTWDTADEAIAVAQKAVATIDVNGVTWDDMCQRWAER